MNILINHVTQNTFEEEVIQSQVPVLIDFWAQWCGPCHAVSPVVEEIARDFEGKLKVVKVNTDDEPELAEQFQITSLPTLLLYAGENEVSRMIGAHPQENIEAFLNEHIV